MSNNSSPCAHASDMVVPENIIALSGRPPLEVLLNIAPVGSNTTCETDVIRDSQPRLALPHSPLRISRMVLLSFLLVLLAWFGPVCHTGYGEQNRDGNGPETSASGGSHTGTDAFGALDPMEKGYSRFKPRRVGRRSGQKRGSDPPQPTRASSEREASRTFACHFYLHDRIGHSACLNVRLARLSDVRQHLLERTHNQVVHCPVCGTTFTGRTTEARRQRDAHVQAATCEPSLSPLNFPGITEDDDRQIREIARTTRTADYSEVRRWFLIWDYLFPGEPRPESPFLRYVPDIQRAFDWAGAIFSDSDRWLALPNEPWTPAMSREEQNARMSSFVQSFITEARDLIGGSSGPMEDSHASRVDTSSYVDVAIPYSSDATVNLGVASLASFDSNPPADTSRRANLDPVSVTGAREVFAPNFPGQVEPNPGEWPNEVASIPFHLMNDSMEDISRHTQQHTASGPITNMQNEPPAPASTVEMEARISTPHVPADPTTDDKKECESQVNTID